MKTNAEVILEAREISKSFPGVRALDRVSLQLRRGKVTALLGENGAGKSTLMNILAGVFAPDEGAILLDGREVRFISPRDAQERGISIIFQELSLVPQLSVAENIFLGREPYTRTGLIDYAAMNAAAGALLRRLDLAVEPTDAVGALRVGQQQVVEIARALSTDARVLILDEPTSSLSQHEVEVLFTVLHELKARGVALVYITHKMDEVAGIGDEVVVMRDGRVVGGGAVAAVSHDEIVRLMAGREPRELFRRTTCEPGSKVLRAEKLSLARTKVVKSASQDSGEAKTLIVREVDLRLCRGEVLGVFGLIGAGRTELLEILFGLHTGRATGDIFIDGQCVEFASPADAIAHGIALAPEDRKREGLVLRHECRSERESRVPRPHPAGGLRGFDPRGRARFALSRAFSREDAVVAPAHANPERRKSAESHPRKVARDFAEGATARRADARDRHQWEARDLRLHR